jgi:hypothetical protein
MSTSPSDDSGDAERGGEILKASTPGPQQIEVGMEVAALDGERIGRVKEVQKDEFLLDRPMAHDLWVPFSSVLAAEDYTSNFRGPVQPVTVVLSVSSAHIDGQHWRRA